MDKETLSNYGWIVICVLVLAVMLALATPFGAYIKEGVQSTTNSLFETEDKALTTALSGAGYNHKLNHYGIIPEGGVYTKNDGTVLTEGQQFPKNPQTNDKYEYEDYEYVFNRAYTVSDNNEEIVVTLIVDENQNGWHVKVKDKTKTEYGEILESVANKYVVNAFATFHNCTEMIISPIIPLRVREVSVLYFNCHKLTTVAQIGHLSAKNAVSAFKNCYSLTTYIGMPESVESGDFSGYALPKSVQNIRSVFSDCHSLKSVPKVPSSVINMYCSFSNCYNLTGTITIDANPTGYEFAFSADKNCPDIILTGKSKLLSEIARAENTTRNIYNTNGDKLN